MYLGHEAEQRRGSMQLGRGMRMCGKGFTKDACTWWKRRRCYVRRVRPCGTEFVMLQQGQDGGTKKNPSAPRQEAERYGTVK
jgi:hypothetical protein